MIDDMGIWSEQGPIWLPRSLYSTRGKARARYVELCDGAPWFPEVRVTARHMRHLDDAPPEHSWQECGPSVPGAIPVWRCE